MNRKERRAAGITKKTPTYNFTEEQLKMYMKEHFKEYLEEERSLAIQEALTIMLVLPMEVLMDYYWQKTYRKKIPEFVSRVLDYYNRWLDGEIDMTAMQKDLWDYGGVKLVMGDQNE